MAKSKSRESTCEISRVQCKKLQTAAGVTFTCADCKATAVVECLINKRVAIPSHVGARCHYTGLPILHPCPVGTCPAWINQQLANNCIIRYREITTGDPNGRLSIRDLAGVLSLNENRLQSRIRETEWALKIALVAARFAGEEEPDTPGLPEWARTIETEIRCKLTIALTYIDAKEFASRYSLAPDQHRYLVGLAQQR